MMDKAQSLSKISKDLMLKEPYYGFFLIMLNKVWRKDLPTAGVSKQNINYQLAINEEFWTGLSDDHKMGLLKHELLHIAFGHLVSFSSFSNKKLANVAMDMEINQYIESSWLPYPTYLNINTFAVEGTLILNLPSEVDSVPKLVPLTEIDTPASAAPSSFVATVPVIVLSWANALSPKTRNRNKPCKLFFINFEF